MKEKMIKLLNILTIILTSIVLLIQKINCNTIFTITIGIIATLLFLFIYQKYIKYEKTFKNKNNYSYLFIIAIISFFISIILKNNLTLTISQIICLIVFYFATSSIFNNERYIATTLFIIIEIIFINNLMDIFYITITSLSILGIEQLDISDESSYYRKKNYLIITIIETMLTYLLITNINFIFYYLLFIIYLFRKVSIKRAIVLSTYGISISIIMIITNMFIKLPFTGLNYPLHTKLLNLYAGLQFILIVIAYSIIFIRKDNKNMLNTILLDSVLLTSIITNNYIEYSIIILLLSIIEYSKALELAPRIVNRKIKLINKSGLNKDNNNIKEVTAVIPNYNYEKYIEERIDSVLFQTYPIKELIVLDDVSKDNSVKVIKKKLEQVKKEYPDLSIKFIPNKVNSGNVFKQWKKCFEESNTDYLWICEADDSASPYFLENVMKAFEIDEDVIISHSESLTMDENNNIIMNNLREWIDIFKTDKWSKNFIEDGKEFNKNYLIINNTIANVSGAVFKKKKDVPFEKYLEEAQEYKLAGDWYFYEKILDYGKIAYCKKSLNYHRMHSSSVTLTTKREKEYEEICKIQNDMKKRYSIDKEVNNKITYRRNTFKKEYGFSDEELELDKIDLSEILKKKKIKNDILLSIIIPVYNTEPFLEKCINSVLKAIPEKTEVLIINDGTPDNSEKIIKQFSEKYKDIIKYYKKENGGLSDTKNYGLKHANGKYIGFVDSDDYVKENMFSCMLKKALIDDADMVYCDVDMVFENGNNRIVNSTNYDETDKLYKHLDTPLMPASWSKIVKKELFNKIDYPKGYNNEDIAVSPILFARSKIISKIDTPFYKYYQRTGSIQNSGFNEKRFVVFYTAHLCFERAKEFDKNIQEKIKGSIYTHQLFGLLFYLIPEEKNRKKRLSYIEKFTEEINKFDNYDTNKYLIEYVKMHNKTKVFKYLKEEKTKRLDIYLRIGI